MQVVVARSPQLTDAQRAEASDKVVRARTTLMRNHTWYGNLTLRLLAVEEFVRTKTMATDGTYMYYNPHFVLAQEHEDIVTICAHEVLHCVLMHVYRFGDRNHKLANIAADYVVNEWLERSGFKLPQYALRDPRFDGMYFEQVYAILEQENPDMGDDEEGGWDPGGEFFAAPDGSDDDGTSGEEPGGTSEGNVKRMTATDWEIAGEEASMLARKAGNMPGNLDHYMKAARESTHDWRAELRRFMESSQPYDFAWSSPNRTYLSLGYVLPGSKREGLMRIGIMIDTSGSVYEDLLNIFGEEVQAIVRETRPEEVEVVYCDTKVNNVEVFYPDDEITLHARGRGGTYFAPALKHFEDNPPVGALYFTDLDNCDRDQVVEPDYPVLWCVPETCANKPVPFGEKIVVSLH